jgi:hypothetical protein
VPVHSPSAAAIQQPMRPIGNLSSLHRRRLPQNRLEVPPPPGSNFGKTKLRSPLESTKLLKKEVKTKLSEAEKPIIAQAWNGRAYVAHAQTVRLSEGACFRSGRASGFSRFCPIAAGPPDLGLASKPPASDSSYLAYVHRPTRSSKMPENRKKHPRSKAGMLHGINNIGQKWGLHRKLECPLESTKTRATSKARKGRSVSWNVRWNQ